jgi:hypothetical protein
MCRCPCFIIRQQLSVTGVLVMALLVIPCIIGTALEKLWNGLVNYSGLNAGVSTPRNV